MLRSLRVPKRKESYLRLTRSSELSTRLGYDRKIRIPLSIELQTHQLCRGFRSRYERIMEEEVKKAQTSGARLTVAGTSGHPSRRNSTSNRRTCSIPLPVIAPQRWSTPEKRDFRNMEAQHLT